MTSVLHNVLNNNTKTLDLVLIEIPEVINAREYLLLDEDLYQSAFLVNFVGPNNAFAVVSSSNQSLATYYQLNKTDSQVLKV